jgi:(2Fe-2S) ferredoxin
MGKKRKLRKKMRKRLGKHEPALVICIGKSCAPRVVSRTLVEQMRAHAGATRAPVRVEVVGCLHVCKKGPIAATYPELEFYKRVDLVRSRRLIDALACAVSRRRR